MLEGEIPAAEVHELQQQLPALTARRRRAGMRLRPLRTGPRHAPTRPRTDNNPLNRKEYLLHVVRRV